MGDEAQAALLLIYIDETDTWGHARVPLYEAIVEKLFGLGVDGATVQTGIMGYGANRRLHRKRLFGVTDDRPVTISVRRTAISSSTISASPTAMAIAARRAVMGASAGKRKAVLARAVLSVVRSEAIPACFAPERNLPACAGRFSPEYPHAIARSVSDEAISRLTQAGRDFAFLCYAGDCRQAKAPRDDRGRRIRNRAAGRLYRRSRGSGGHCARPG